MSLILFYDTETTGIPLFNKPSEHPSQPHIVQLAAILVDEETRKTVSSIDLIIEPNDYEIPQETTGIHGISTEFARDVGVNLEPAIDTFMDMWSGRKRIAFNESFDARIIRIAMHRLSYPENFLESWKAGEKECAMHAARSYTNLPKNKPPRLSEAYKHFFGVEFQDAHSAMADTLACRDIYFAIQDLKAKIN